MKDSIKRLLGAAVVKLPWGAKHAIFHSLADDMGHLHAIQDLAPKASITGLETRGRYGAVSSAASDRIVFGTYARTGWWAQSTNNILAGFFSEAGGTYLDIGANIGLTLLPLLNRKDIRCMGIEPDPTNFRNLRLNVQRNTDRTDIELFNVALFRERGELRFELAEENLGDHRIRFGDVTPGAFAEDKRQVIRVPGVPLDELVTVPDGERFAVKLDTQGAEPFVVEGGQKTLAKAQLFILEFSPYHIRRLGGSPDVLLELIGKSFSRVRLAFGEGEFTEEVTPTEATRRLREAYESATQANDLSYFDVCCEK